jgi:hypothetical protein
MAADARANLIRNSGQKVLWQTGTGQSLFTDMLTGDDMEVTVDFASLGYPNARIPFKALVALNNHVQENCQGIELFGSGAGAHGIFIASSEMIEAHREESGLKTETLALVQGGDAEATAALKRYQFADYPYRGLRSAVDKRPLRFNLVDGDNFPVFVEPYTEVAADEGSIWKVNPHWKEARYEVSFLVYKGSFRRNVPARYAGEGDIKFPEQFAMGELKWFNVASNGCNEFNETGHFNYNIVRNWEPLAPWAVIPILSKRCAPDYGSDACSTSSESSGD